ncbi:hypothetical protein [Halarsenatibacter silvermanii]|uniref:Uncharacterized protein n=1 Tax=Halarsenatibacter silvermanii TaxID=321763 RepID=A0A1G9RBZ2_9FIRM|nr:hypothetical protein [Halarsenatibacter silvermanii]SDM20748.1 hypothetical protein SAMN04488692_12132 [Halarsenatibacter silvermanii]
MYVSDSYLNTISEAGGANVESVALVDGGGNEVTGRKTVPGDFELNYDETGVWRPDADLTFQISGGTTVAGWRAYDDPSAGNELGGADLSEESYDNDGEYTLLADQTGFVHQLQN